MRTCQDIAVAYEQSLDASVSKWTKLAIRTHFLHCKRCKQYADKSAKLQHYLKHRILNKSMKPLKESEKAALLKQVRKGLSD